MKYHSLILIFCFASEALSSNLISKCNVSDLACIENTVNTALPQILVGIPELGVESSDPLYYEIVRGNLPALKFTLYNSTTTGYKNCKISNLKLNDDVTTVNCNAICVNLIVSGGYQVSGHLFSFPIEGKGNFKFFAEKYILTLNFDIHKVTGSDGKTHLFIKILKIKAIPVNVTFDFQNLFNGEQSELAEAVHKYSQANWREVAEFIQDPIWEVSLNKVTGNVNKYLQHLALEDILLLKTK